MSAHGKKDIEPVIPDPTFEDRDLNLRALGVFGLIVFITVILTFASMAMMFNVLNKRAIAKAGPQDVRNIPEAGPILQAFPVGELVKYQEKQDDYLKSFSWVDKEKKVAAIPVDLAIQIAAQTDLGADMGKLDLKHLPGGHDEHGHGDHHGEKHGAHDSKPKADPPAPQPEPAPEPQPEPPPEPKPEPAPEPKPEPAPEPKPEPAPEPKPEPAPEPKPEPKPEPVKPEPAPEPKPEVKPSSDPKPAKPAEPKMTMGEMENNLKNLLKTEEGLIESLGEKHPKVIELREAIKTLKEAMKKAAAAPAEAAPKKGGSIKELLGE